MEVSQGAGKHSRDVDDLRVIRALQLAPRASFARIGQVLGMHERTVARRYRSLHRDGVLRIFGTVNPLALGQQVWQVRVRCRPDASEALAAGLAARDDVVWVGLTAAGSEVSFTIGTVSAERRDLLLTRTLPRAANVLDIDAAVVLHIFLGMGADDWSALGHHLTPEQTAALARPPVASARSRERFELEAHDVAMLRVLARDGRASNATLAHAAGISAGRASRRVATLVESGVLVIDNDLASEAFGYGVRARLLLRVAPSHIEAVGHRLAQMPEVSFVASTSGPNNVIASMTCRELADLHEFTTAHVGALDGIQTLEVLPVQRIVKQSGGLVVDGRLVDAP